MKDVIIACDFDNKISLYEFLDKFKDEKPFLKIGMELFYAEGVSLVKELKSKGHKIFLDLKLHDIPNTVAKTVKVLSRLDVDIINLHAQGTSNMMKGAKKALENLDKKPLLIAVTQLTSTSEEDLKTELLVEKSMKDTVLHYAQNAKNSGLDGIVCSALESKYIHDKLGKDFITVTPGIRFENNSKDDQVRIVTPKKAKDEGADYIVVGRAITNAENPLLAYQKCLKDGGII